MSETPRDQGPAYRQFFLAVLFFICADAIGQDSLRPIPPYGLESVDHYERIVFEKLVGPAYCDAWMIVRGTSRPEFAVLITRKVGPGKPTPGTDPRDLQFIAQRVEADELIVKIKPNQTESYVNPKMSPGAGVHVESADLSDVDARTFIDSWFAGLAQVRYDDRMAATGPLATATDGTNYDFHSEDRYGATYEPAGGVPFLMVRSGLCLSKFVQAAPAARASILLECRRANEEIAKSAH